MVKLVSCALTLFLLASTTDAAIIANWRGQRRVLILSAPSPINPQLAAQRHVLDTWRQGAADRDMTTVEVIARQVSGSADGAASLKARYALPPRHFEAVLIGKDGHVALRSTTPLPAARLEAAIDAMPMRRAGER